MPLLNADSVDNIIECLSQQNEPGKLPFVAKELLNLQKELSRVTLGISEQTPKGEYHDPRGFGGENHRELPVDNQKGLVRESQEPRGVYFQNGMKPPMRHAKSSSLEEQGYPEQNELDKLPPPSFENSKLYSLYHKSKTSNVTPNHFQDPMTRLEPYSYQEIPLEKQKIEQVPQEIKEQGRPGGFSLGNFVNRPGFSDRKPSLNQNSPTLPGKPILNSPITPSISKQPMCFFAFRADRLAYLAPDRLSGLVSIS